MDSPIKFLWILLALIAGHFLTVSSAENGTDAVEAKVKYGWQCENLRSGESCLLCESVDKEFQDGKNQGETFNEKQRSDFQALGEQAANERCKSKQCIPIKKEGVQLYVCFGDPWNCGILSSGYSCLTCEKTTEEIKYGTEAGSDLETFNEEQRARYNELGEKQANKRCLYNVCKSTVQEGVQLYLCKKDDPEFPLWLILIMVFSGVGVILIIVARGLCWFCIIRAHTRQQRQNLLYNQPMMPGPGPGVGQANTGPPLQAYLGPSGNPSGSYAYPPPIQPTAMEQQPQQAQSTPV